MILKSKRQSLGKYKGKSTFSFFRDIQSGDILEFGLDISQSGGCYGGRVAEVYIHNFRTGENFYTSLHMLKKYSAHLDTNEV